MVAMIEVFGNRPKMRVLDFVLTEMLYTDYSLTEIAKLTDVSWGTLHSIWKEFKKEGLVVDTREIGNAKMYMANKASPIFRVIKNMALDMAIMKATSAEERHKINIKEPESIAQMI